MLACKVIAVNRLNESAVGPEGHVGYRIGAKQSRLYRYDTPYNGATRTGRSAVSYLRRGPESPR